MREVTQSETEAVAEMKAKLCRLETAEGRRRGYDLRPASPSDVIIATPPKCGTTWMQQIVHGLRSGGSMDFDEVRQIGRIAAAAGWQGHELPRDALTLPSRHVAAAHRFHASSLA